MLEITKGLPILVTGATGYVAGHIIKLLLEAGVSVHAAVRNPDDTEKLEHLNVLAENSSGKITYFKSDLLENGSYAEAMRRCRIVFHTASPFTLNVKNPQEDLINPAQLGTRNVLAEANRQESVEKVILTSSCAAIYGDAIDCQAAPLSLLTEAQWNTTSSLKHQPYSYSKTLAEQEAWRIEKEQTRWKLVVINPSLVIGPGVSPHSTSESFNLIKQMGDGTMKNGIPQFGVGAVDVRDVAYAHVSAAFTDSAQGRHIISGHNTDFYKMALLLQPNYGENYPVPIDKLSKSIVWLLGPLVNKAMTRKSVSRNVDIEWKADNTKSVEKLGVSYRPLSDSMNEMFQQLIDSGQLKPS